ncbi:MAG: ABC transporter permease [Stenotrophomonas sp.]
MVSKSLSRSAGHFALWRTLVLQDLAVRYRGTLLGRAWPFLMPLAMLAVYGFVFGAVFRARWPGLDEGDHLGFSLNLFVGLLVHGLLAETVGQAPSLLQRNSNFVRKIVFPLPVLVAVPMGTALFHMLLGLLLVFGVNAAWGSGGHWQALAVPLILVPYVAMLYGIALAFTALGVYLRDLAQVVTVLVTVALFTGAVLYPVSMVPPALADVVVANPISWPAEALRQALLHGQWPAAPAFAGYTLAAALVMLLGALLFRTLRPGFADVL